jgi:predicted dithiol-disulfide oxidoreductase (DUF899 family)
MQHHSVVSPEEWLAARKPLLLKVSRAPLAEIGAYQQAHGMGISVGVCLRK